MKKRMTIPFFLPEIACPNRCVFCNQHSITNSKGDVSLEMVNKTIVKYLKTKKDTVQRVEAGFFGGSFTGQPVEVISSLLHVIQPYIEKKQINSIRVSTRPDYINESILDLLKRYNVETIELGVQSFRNEVLHASKRGHAVKEIETASKMIVDNSFRLGHQLMIGLPCESDGDEIFNAEKSVLLRADDIRIYPVLVLRDTELEVLYRKGEYIPLSVEDALRKTVNMMKIFNNAGKNIIKVGLHPSDNFTNGDLVAGPWHPNFRQLAEKRV